MQGGAGLKMKNERLGEKIREKRQEKGMSLQEVSKKIGKTSSFLSQVERNLVEPSITSLREIAGVLEVPIFYFLIDSPEYDPVVRRDKRKALRFPEYELTFELLSPDLNRKMEILEGRIPPGSCTCPEPLAHNGEECTLVLQGTMKIQVGDREYLLEEGDSIYYYASIPHRIVNVGSEELVFVSSITPPHF